MSTACQPARIMCRDEEIMNTLKFAGKLEIYRRLKNLTLADVARICAVNVDTLERLIYRKGAPCAATVKRLERGLGIVFEAEDFEERGTI